MSARSDRLRRYAHQEPGTIGVDISTQTAPAQAPRAPTHRERKTAEIADQNFQAMRVLEQMAAHMGGIFNFLKEPPQGDVLGMVSATIPASGSYGRGFEQVFQAITLCNNSSGTLTAHASTAMSQAPRVGTGVVVVLPGCYRTVALRGPHLTVYGPVGANFDVTAYARPRDPSGGALTGGGPAGQAIGAIGAASLTPTATLSPTAPNLTAVLTDIGLDTTELQAGGTITITGLAIGTLVFQAGNGQSSFLPPWNTPQPASGPGVSIVVTVGAPALNAAEAIFLGGYER